MRSTLVVAAGIIALSLSATSSAIGQDLILKGQLWTSITAGDDPFPGRSKVEQTVGYIPSLSWSKSLGTLRSVDLEAAYRWSALLDGAMGQGEAGTYDSGNLYRLWGRFATESLELRLGLQKIAFGPGRVLRPLMWFDTFDIKDPTGQTEGVGALRMRWFLHPELTAWLWIVRPDHIQKNMLGGRLDFGGKHGNLALTFHHRENTSNLDYAGRPLLLHESGEYRVAVDARWDGFMGLWTEAVHTFGSQGIHNTKPSSISYAMVGGDYTLPWLEGIYVMLEHLYSRSDIELRSPDTDIVNRLLEEKHLTILMASVPWGLFNSVMGLVSYDWENQRQSNFLMWQRTYDAISFNLIIYSNPQRADYQPEYQIALPETLTGFGDGIQFMIVFNH